MFQVRECVNRVSFWSQIAEFCKLLAPITNVLRGTSSRTSSLADVVLHWLHLARFLQAAETGANLPHGELLTAQPFRTSECLSTCVDEPCAVRLPWKVCRKQKCLAMVLLCAPALQ